MTDQVKEVVDVVPADGKNGKGRPQFSDAQYWDWLDLMRTWLKAGNSIHYACNKSGLESHYDVILEKYKAGGSFSRKIDGLRATPGELVNETLVSLIEKIAEKVKKDMSITHEDFDVLKLMAEKHRTSQPFFTDRHENADADPSKVGKILDILEEQTDYAKLGQTAAGQVVASNPPVQDKGQNGSTDNVQP